MKTFKQFQEEKKFGPDGKPISKKDDLLKRMSKGYDKNVKGKLKDLESKARKPTQLPGGGYEVKYKKDGTPYTKPSAPDAKTGADRIDDKTGTNMRKTKGQTYSKAPKTNTKSKTYGSNKDYRTRTPKEMTRDFKRGIDNYIGEDPLRKRTATNTKSRTVRKNVKDILKQSFGNKNKVKNPITKIGKKIPVKPTVYSKVANVAKSLGPKGRAVALGALAVGAIATAVANRGSDKKKDKTGSYQFNLNKPKGYYIKGVPKARVDKPDSAQVSKPKKGSWNDRQLKMTNEGVASLALKGGSKLIPALISGIGAAGTIMQARKYKTRKNPSGRVGIGKKDKRKIGNMEKEYHKKETKKEVKQSNRSDDMIVAKQGEVQKQNKLIDKYIKKQKSRKPFDPVKSEPTIEPPTLTGRVDKTKGAPTPKRTTFKKPFSGKPENQFEDVVPTNNVGGGQIAGTVEAGDNPPVNKKKKKGEPTIIARGCMPGARGRFKGGVELLASFKKNKYT
jgi:hypothetical protein